MISGLRHLSGLWPPFAGAAQYLIHWAERYGLQAEIVSGYRSLEEQRLLYAMGRTPAEIAQRVSKHGRGGSVTDAPPGSSPHNYGLALDFDNPQVRDLAGKIGFGTIAWDPGHVEWPGWRTLLG